MKGNWWRYIISLQWRHNGRDSVSNHQPHDCLLNRLFRRRSKKTSKLRVTGLCVGNSPGTGEFPTQMASNAENVSISWRHHGHIYVSVNWAALVQVMVWRHTNTWTNVNSLSINPLETNFNEIGIKIHDFSFTKMHLKMLYAKWWSFCPWGDELFSGFC